MPVPTILLITLAAIIALGFVYFKYFLGNKNRGGNTYILAGLRFLSVFILLVLLINPGIKQLELEIEKPQLLIAIDGSASIEHLAKGDSVQQVAQLIKDHPAIMERFEVHTYKFGRELTKLNNGAMEFDLPQTNLSSAMSAMEKLNPTRQTAIVLLTDGNQTLGEDFAYYKAKGNTGIFPVVVGDTTVHADLFISNLNVNRYAFLNNDFPVETIINYQGTNPIQSRFEIREGNSVLYSQNLNFDGVNNSVVVSPALSARKLGVTVYDAIIVPVESEINLINNNRKFAVEVIDERTSVLILSSYLHPDLGAIKSAIESNQQREASIRLVNDLDIIDFTDFQLIVLYQPNNNFKSIYEKISAENLNSWVITGTQTDWDFLNAAQLNFTREINSQTQDYFGVYNPNFSKFQFEDLNFAGFPPLEDKFGPLNMEGELFGTLLFQQVESLNTQDPLLAVFENNSSKHAALFGENIWKWRAQSYVDTGSFEDFDSLIGKLVLYLASTQEKERLALDVNPVYLQSENIQVEARYFDENYFFDPSGQVELKLKNKATGTEINAEMLISGNRFVFEINNLEPGEYSVEIKEKLSGLQKRGEFIVIENTIEQQFSSANLPGLQNFAQINSTSLYFLNDTQTLINSLLAADVYVSVQKSREKTLPLINWRILLFFLVFSLAAEWFLRKYFGLI